MHTGTARPPSNSPGFRAYFEAIIKSSVGLRESTRRMGYTSTSTVIHFMKKFHLDKPAHWNVRSPCKKFDREYVESAVRSAYSQREAARSLGYKDPKMVAYQMKKLGIGRPEQWNKRPSVSWARREGIPKVIIQTSIGRNWVAGLTQGETCIQSRYDKNADATVLQLDTAMVDSAPIFLLSDYVGMKKPSKPVKNHSWKPVWHKNVSGLRALRVLQEILPYLLGERRKEAEKAIAFFSPFGRHEGSFRNEERMAEC